LVFMAGQGELAEQRRNVPIGLVRRRLMVYSDRCQIRLIVRLFSFSITDLTRISMLFHQIHNIQGAQKVPVPSQFQQAVDIRKRILFDSLIYSPSFSATQTRRRIQSKNTIYASSKVRSFHPRAIASSISSLEENFQSLRMWFNIPKSQKLHGLTPGE
jgi:hypothetical protein